MITGSEGFICGYLVENLLSNGHSVVGVDNFSKYGEIRRSYAIPTIHLLMVMYAIQIY